MLLSKTNFFHSFSLPLFLSLPLVCPTTIKGKRTFFETLKTSGGTFFAASLGEIGPAAGKTLLGAFALPYAKSRKIGTLA